MFQRGAENMPLPLRSHALWSWAVGGALPCTVYFMFIYIQLIIYSTDKVLRHFRFVIIGEFLVKKFTMVCIPCLVIPVLLWIFHKYIQPVILKFWNPWASKCVSAPPDSGGDCCVDSAADAVSSNMCSKLHYIGVWSLRVSHHATP